MKSWKQKVIVITGASSGAGRAIALELAKKQTNLVLAARREKALDELAEECLSFGATARVVPTDVRNVNEVRHLAESATRISGVIDVWVNNAGVLAAGALEQLPAAINEQVIMTNLVGYINGAHEVLPYFKEQGYGTLINNISIGGWFPTPYAAAYTASKFGLRGFSEALKGELSAYSDIHVVDLYPPFLDTPGIQHAANYTGKRLMPAPPIYDPSIVANAVIKRIENPCERDHVVASSGFIRLAYALFPKLSRNITASGIRKYLKHADPIHTTPGNVLTTVEFGSSIHGGWGKPASKTKRVLPFAIIAALTAGISMYSKMKTR
ncbi:MAG: SDR family oxidoreductase [Chitinophagaceae bacterium]|nr:MAG: SDR family oxidoreductase [Chitinophagaceae bacterium]